MASPEFSSNFSSKARLAELRELAEGGYPLADNVITFDYTHLGYSSTHFHELNAQNRRRLPLGEVVGRLVTAPRWTAIPTLVPMEHAPAVSLAILDETEDGQEYPVPGLIKVSHLDRAHSPDIFTVQDNGSIYTKPDFLHEEPSELSLASQRNLVDLIRRSLEHAHELRQ